MRKTVRSGFGIIIVSLLLLSCTTYAVYSRNFLAGKDLFNAGNYDEARSIFRMRQVPAIMPPYLRKGLELYIIIT